MITKEEVEKQIAWISIGDWTPSLDYELKLLTEIERLQKVAEYARHTQLCQKWTTCDDGTELRECTCGFDEVKK